MVSICIILGSTEHFGLHDLLNGQMLVEFNHHHPHKNHILAYVALLLLPISSHITEFFLCTVLSTINFHYRRSSLQDLHSFVTPEDNVIGTSDIFILNVLFDSVVY